MPRMNFPQDQETLLSYDLSHETGSSPILPTQYHF